MKIMKNTMHNLQLSKYYFSRFYKNNFQYLFIGLKVLAICINCHYYANLGSRARIFPEGNDIFSLILIIYNGVVIKFYNIWQWIMI